MPRPRAHRLIPPLIMAAVSAIPVVTTAEILNRAAGAGSGTAGASAPATSAPATSAPAPAPTAKPSAGATSPPTPHTYAGPVVNDQFGGVQATITVTGKKITAVSISAPQNDQRSADINSQAVPMLQSETLQAQSANVNVISGATETSDAYIQSLQGALTQAGI